MLSQGFFLGQPVLEFNDAPEKARATLTVEDRGPSLEFRDAQEKARLAVGVTQLRTVGTGVLQQFPESSIVLFDQAEQVLWKVP